MSLAISASTELVGEWVAELDKAYALARPENTCGRQVPAEDNYREEGSLAGDPLHDVCNDSEERAIILGSAEIRPPSFLLKRSLHVRGHKNRGQAVSCCFRRKN